MARSQRPRVSPLLVLSVFLLLELVLAEDLFPDFSSSCKNITSCSECANTTGCHFCAKDRRCHRVGSVFGCVVGMDCVEECARKEPKFVGYGTPPMTELIAVVSLGLTILLSCCACAMCLNYCRRSRGRRSYEVRELESFDNEEAREALLKSPAAGTSENVFVVERAAKKSRFSWGKLVFGLFAVLLAGGITALGVLYSPQIPVQNVCNRALDITSVWETITDLSFDYKVLVSTYNPNRLSFVLQEANVTFGHNGSEVGYWYTNDTWVAQAGSISDVLVTAHFKLKSLGEAKDMYSDFKANRLWLDINATVRGYIEAGSTPIYYLGFKAPSVRIRVGADAPRDLCNCPWA